MSDAKPTVTIGDKTFPIAPLRLGRLRKVWPQITALSTMGSAALPSSEQMDAMIVVVHAGIAAADEAVTLEVFTAHVDELEFAGILELAKAFKSIGEISGLKQAPGPSSGEAGRS
jgi:hypothetical protein